MRHPLPLSLSLLLLLSACGTPSPAGAPFPWADFQSPPAEYRPWVRWWWPGTDVADDELRREVALLAEKGFGGAEIQPLDAALDPKASADELARRRDWDSDAYWGHVRTALDAASEAGIRLDLTIGSGWPTGGAHVAPDDSLRMLVFAERAVEGPAKVTLDLSTPHLPAFYELAAIVEPISGPMVRWLPETARRMAVIAARETGGARDENPLVLTDTVNLDPATVLDLTAEVGEDGKLAWTAPDGKWRVIAFFDMADGEYLSFCAQSEAGYVVDHLDAPKVRANLDRLAGERTGLDPYFGSVLRALFTDSYELKTERHFSADFLSEFRTRRGYDLVPWLPAVVLPGADSSIFEGAGVRTLSPFTLSDDDGRVARDYAQTVSDLYLERYQGTTNDWAEARGMKSRVQPYGMRIDVIRAAGATGIPETEQLYAGGLEPFLKLVSSGAHLYGREVVSAEALVWAGRDWMTTPVKLKAAVDKLLTSGVNQVVYHGFPYRKLEGYGEPGWHAFSSPFSGAGTYSTHIGEADPFWTWQEQTNRYVARCQLALRQGTPDVDVLVRWPFLGAPAALLRHSDVPEPLFGGRLDASEPPPADNRLWSLVDGLFGGMDPEGQDAWVAELWPALQAIEDAGYTWDWVNDHSLAEATAKDGLVDVRGRAYRAVVLAGSQTIEPEAAEAVAALAEAGAVVIVAGETPALQPGHGDAAAGDARVRAAMTKAAAGGHAVFGRPVGDTVAALASAGVLPVFSFAPADKALRQARVSLPRGGRITFLRNPRPEAVSVDLASPQTCPDGRWVDAWTGRTWGAPADGALAVDLPAWGSVLLFCNVVAPPDADVEAPLPPMPGHAIASAQAIPLTSFHLSVTGDDVKDKTFSQVLDALGDWRDVEALRFASTPGRYSTTLRLDRELAEGASLVLDLGAVAGVASVTVAGKDAGTVLVPPYALEIGPLVGSEIEVPIEVTVTPPLRNRLIGQGEAGDPGAPQFKGKTDSLLPAGLLGPVTAAIRM